MKSIPLSLGYDAIVDDADFDKVAVFKWSASEAGNKVYARRMYRGPKKEKLRMYMHRFILDAQPGLEVDHINGNGLDNRRENLRLCTHAEQQMAQRTRPVWARSKYRGVSFAKREELWLARLIRDQKLVYQGYFDTELEAAQGYDAAAKQYFGEFSQLNFP